MTHAIPQTPVPDEPGRDVASELIGLGHVVANCRGVAGLPALFATHLADRLMADRVACYGLREDGVHLVAVAGDDDAALGNLPTSELSPEACGLLGIEGGSDGPSGPPTHIGGETHGFSAGLDIYHGSARAAVDSDDGWGGVLIPLMAGGGVVGHGRLPSVQGSAAAGV